MQNNFLSRIKSVHTNETTPPDAPGNLVKISLYFELKEIFKIHSIQQILTKTLEADAAAFLGSHFD